MPLVWVPEADNSQIFASRACTYDETTSKSEIQKDLKRARNEIDNGMAITDEEHAGPPTPAPLPLEDAARVPLEMEAREEEVEAHEEKLEGDEEHPDPENREKARQTKQRWRQVPENREKDRQKCQRWRQVPENREKARQSRRQNKTRLEERKRKRGDQSYNYEKNKEKLQTLDMFFSTRQTLRAG